MSTAVIILEVLRTVNPPRHSLKVARLTAPDPDTFWHFLT